MQAMKTLKFLNNIFLCLFINTTLIIAGLLAEGFHDKLCVRLTGFDRLRDGYYPYNNCYQSLYGVGQLWPTVIGAACITAVGLLFFMIRRKETAETYFTSYTLSFICLWFIFSLMMLGLAVGVRLKVPSLNTASMIFPGLAPWGIFIASAFIANWKRLEMAVKIGPRLMKVVKTFGILVAYSTALTLIIGRISTILYKPLCNLFTPLKKTNETIQSLSNVTQGLQCFGGAPFTFEGTWYIIAPAVSTITFIGTAIGLGLTYYLSKEKRYRKFFIFHATTYIVISIASLFPAAYVRAQGKDFTIVEYACLFLMLIAAPFISAFYSAGKISLPFQKSKVSST